MPAYGISIVQGLVQTKILGVGGMHVQQVY